MNTLALLYFGGLLYTAGLLTESTTRVYLGYINVPKKLRSFYVPGMLCMLLLWPFALPLGMFVIAKRGILFEPDEMFELPPVVYQGTCPFCEIARTLEVINDDTDKCTECTKTFTEADLNHYYSMLHDYQLTSEDLQAMPGPDND